MIGPFCSFAGIGAHSKVTDLEETLRTVKLTGCPDGSTKGEREREREWNLSSKLSHKEMLVITSIAEDKHLRWHIYSL